MTQFDVGLSAVNIKLGFLRTKSDGLSVEVDGKFEVVVDKCFLSLGFEIGRHERGTWSVGRMWRVLEGREKDRAF